MLEIFYGGTFDPVHNGHLAIARAARDRFDTPVSLMPAADPPHRPPPGANASQRAEMVDLALIGEQRLVIDRRELQRDSRSYTIDTLRELRRELGPDVPVALLIGADSFIGLPAWREWQALFDFSHFIVASRPGSPIDEELPLDLADFARDRWAATCEDLTRSASGRLFRLDQPLFAESASDIRRRIGADEAWQTLVPVRVADFIVRHGLYQSAPAAPIPL